MVGGHMDIAINEVGIASGDEKLAPNGRIAVMYDEHRVGETEGGRDGLQYALFQVVGKQAKRIRCCTDAEASEIRKGLKDEVYARCETKMLYRGNMITFITL